MNTTVKTRLDNLLMTTLIVTSLVMATLGAVQSSPDAQAVMNSASHNAQSVPTPTAKQPIPYREAAIVVTAPRIKPLA